MKNNYIVNGKNVIDIIFDLPKKGKSKIRYFLLEDNTKIKANGTIMKIKCSICNLWHEYAFASRYEDKVYVCMSCNKKGSLNPFFGKKHSQELKDRLSAERKGKWNVGKDNPMFGKPCFYKMSEDEKQTWKNNISKSASGENNPMFGKSIFDFMTDEEIATWRKNNANAQKNRSPEEKERTAKKLSDIQKKLQAKDPIAYSKLKAKGGYATKNKACNYQKTKPEIKLEEFLKANNIKYDYSCIMGSKERCFQYDFIVHGCRILIEVQGDYWHGNPEIYNKDGSNGKKKLNTIQKKNIERDKSKRNFAIEKQFKIIYIWESEINKNDFSKLKEIL